jgi:hypothetical protein
MSWCTTMSVNNTLAESISAFPTSGIALIII